MNSLLAEFSSDLSGLVSWNESFEFARLNELYTLPPQALVRVPEQDLNTTLEVTVFFFWCNRRIMCKAQVNRWDLVF